MREVHSPKEDVAKSPVLIISEATTEIKSAIAKGVSRNNKINDIAAEVNNLINKYCLMLPLNMRKQAYSAFKQMFLRDHYIFSRNVKTILQNANNDGYKVSSMAELFQVEDSTIRNRQTDLTNGSPIISKYQQRVRDQVKVMSANPAMFKTIKDGKPYQMSVRNLAEMTVRYEENLKDVKKLQDEGEDLVWTSSHVDCSARCEPYQGKLYSVSGKNAGKIIDGHRVGKLQDALLGPNKDGNGIINGYNCRHYLIPYRKGSKPPVEYDRNKIKRERDINTRQRNYENQIRQLKMQERLARESGDTEIANRLNKRWHNLYNKYSAYSLRNERPFYRWRTQVMRNEKPQETKWGIEQTKQVKNEIETYCHSIVENRVGHVFLPNASLIKDLSVNEKALIRFRQQGDLDETGKIVNRSASRHIVDSHKEQIDDTFINDFVDTIKNGKAIPSRENILLQKYLYSIEKENKYLDKYFVVVIHKNNEIEYFIKSAYVKTYKRKKIR